MVIERIGGIGSGTGRVWHKSGVVGDVGGGMRGRIWLGVGGEYVTWGRVRHFGSIRDVTGDGIDRGIKEGEREVIVYIGRDIETDMGTDIRARG